MGQCNTTSDSKDHELQTSVLEEEADRYLMSNDYNKAISYCHKAIDFYTKNEGQYSDKVANVNMKIVRIYERQLMLKESLEYYEKIFVIYSTLYGTRSPKALEVSSIIAKRAYLNNDYEKASQFYNLLLQHVIEVQGDTCANAGSIHDKLGEIYKELKNYPQSAVHYGKALHCLKSSKSVDPETLALEYSRLGSIFLYHLNRFEQAIECFEFTVDLMKSVHGEVNENMSIAYLNLGTAKAKLKRLDLAQFDLIKAISIAIEADWHLESSRNETLTNIFNILSSVYEAQGKLKESLETDKAWCKLMLKDEEKNQYYEAYFIRMIGDALFEQGDYEEAAKTFFEAIEIFQRIPDIAEDISKTLLRLGIAYFEIEDDRADDCLKEALKCQRDLGNQINETILQIKKYQAISKSRQGFHEEALTDLNALLRDYNMLYTHPLHISIVDVRFWIGKIYKKMGRLEFALENLTQAIDERMNSKLNYLLDGETRYNIGGLIYQLPDLSNKHDSRSKIFKRLMTRLNTKAEIVGQIRLLPSVESIKLELDEIC